MSNILNCQFYCLSFNNEEKNNNMLQRFKKLEIDCKFHSGIPHNDKRIWDTLNAKCKRHWSMTYGHLDLIHDFYYNSDKKYAIICEDDIELHVNFKTILNKVLCDFFIMKLDILLLGYLLPYKIGYENLLTNFKLKKPIPKEAHFKYHEYPNYLNGTHMYVITKSYAKHLLNNYYYNYAGIYDQYFTPDDILIKDGNKALIYPMLAIENNKQDDLYHQLCRNINCTELYS